MKTGLSTLFGIFWFGMFASACQAQAVTYGAIGNGMWSDAATWTPIGGPPGIQDTANIGSTTPSGAATSATVTLTGDTEVRNVSIGRDAGTSGVLDLNGHALIVSQLTELGLGQAAFASIVHNGGTLDTFTLTLRNSSSFNFATGDTVRDLRVFGGSTSTTASLGNVIGSVDIFDQNSTVNLGSNLVVGADVDIRGSGTNMATLNAGGYDITARDIFVGRLGNQGQITNRGAIVATRDLQVSGGTFTLGEGDSVGGQVNASEGGTLHLLEGVVVPGAMAIGGGTINTSATSNLSDFVNVLSQNSRLNLGSDLALSLDLTIRGTGNNAATVNANGYNIMARDIFVGGIGSAGEVINRGTITATRNLESSFSQFSLGANDSVANLVRASNGGVLNLHASTASQGAEVNSGGTINTVATSNLSTSVNLFNQNSTLNLGADLWLSQDLVIRGTGSNFATVSANGFDITARDIYVGRLGNQGRITNRGGITATRDFEVSVGVFSLNAIDSVANQLRATNGGVLNLHANTAAQSAQVTLGSTMNVAATKNIASMINVLNSNSTLNLGADLVLSQDLEIQGTNANVATVNANGFNITARDIFIGRSGNSGQITNRGVITALRDLEASRVSFSLGANDSVANLVRASNNGVLNLHANTAAQSALVTNGASINTESASNLSAFVVVADRNSTFNLGADLALSQHLSVRGTVLDSATINANGFKIAADQLNIGLSSNRGRLINDGAITVNQLNLDGRSSLTLTDGNDLVQEQLSLVRESTLTVLQSLGDKEGLTLNGNSFFIDSFSDLRLNFDDKVEFGTDWAFRWANPENGDRIGLLTNYLNWGRIAIVAPSATSIFDGGDGYTYIGYMTVPEPSAFVLVLAAFAGICSYRLPSKYVAVRRR